jgi:hypothetical protein
MILKSNVANPDSCIDPRTILLDQASDRRPRFTQDHHFSLELQVYYLFKAERFVVDANGLNFGLQSN